MDGDESGKVVIITEARVLGSVLIGEVSSLTMLKDGELVHHIWV